MLDVEALLRPAALQAPSGPNLQYAPEYALLEKIAAGKPERQAGGTILPAEPPDWRAALDAARSLFERSKDLRIALLLARAALETAGFAGFAQGAAVVRGTIERYWDAFHPALDLEDGNDPTARATAMVALTHRDTIQAVRGAPLVVSRQSGAVTLRVLESLGGKAGSSVKPPPDAKASPGAAAAPTAAAVEAAFQQASLESLTETAAAVARCSHEIRSIADVWAERLPGAGPDFTELRAVIAQAEHALKLRLERREPGRTVAAAAGPEGAGAATSPVVSHPASGEIRSRDEVIRALDAICAYYARSEPSSPLPLLLQRSKRLVTASFAEILKELLPESIPNLQKIAGKTEG